MKVKTKTSNKALFGPLAKTVKKLKRAPVNKLTREQELECQRNAYVNECDTLRQEVEQLRRELFASRLVTRIINEEREELHRLRRLAS